MKTEPNPSRRFALKAALTSLIIPSVVAKETLSTAKLPKQPFSHPHLKKVEETIVSFAAMSANTSSCLIQSSSPTSPWQLGYFPKRQLFVGSAVKTFILAQFLRDVENGFNGIKEEHMATIDDNWRSPGSPVFGELTGKTSYRSILEAMIAHSDNTATDIALAQVQPSRVRALIQKAGLPNTQLPSSTRKLFSYLAGAKQNIDLGWSGMVSLDKGETLGLQSRTEVINPYESMLSTASEMVHWYEQSLTGKFFKKPETLAEYKRIQSMADALSKIVPKDTLAFGKGGSIDWLDFHCLCVPGQMLVNRTPITFCFTLNWQGGEQTSISRLDEFVAKVSTVLSEATKLVGA